MSNAALCAAQQINDDRESHERSSGSSKSQAAQERRIDILPAEDEDGKSSYKINRKLSKNIDTHLCKLSRSR